MTYFLDNKTDKELIDTPFNSISLTSTTFKDISNSYITFEPKPGSSLVVYSYINLFRSRSSTTSAKINLKLQYSDDGGANWSDWGDNTDILILGLGSSQRQFILFSHNISFCLDSWVGEKSLRIMAAIEDGSSAYMQGYSPQYDPNGVRSYNSAKVSCKSF